MIHDEFASGQELSLEKLFDIHPMHHLRQAIGLGGGASALGKSGRKLSRIYWILACQLQPNSNRQSKQPL